MADQTAQSDEVVTQGDREAFASVYDAKAPKYAEQIRAGELDETPLLETLARYRLASTATLQASLDEARAENARLREALTPSGDTKAAYMGEFSFEIMETYFDEDGETFVEQPRKVYVPWDTIKEIMAAILARAALKETAS